MKFSLDDIVIDSNFVIDWSQSSAYKFTPVRQPDVAEVDHKYTHVEFLGHQSMLDPDQTIRATWRIDNGWDYMNAMIYNPENTFHRLPCHSLVKNRKMDELAPNFTLPSIQCPSVPADPSGTFRILVILIQQYL